MTDLTSIELTTPAKPTPAETTPGTPVPPASPTDAHPSLPPTPRPDGLPDKFWNEEQPGIRTDALVKSYLSLEKRLGAGGGIPETVDGYSITPPSDLIRSDPNLNAQLFEAGFTQQQAQLVYTLAGQHLHPLVTQMSAEMEAQHQVARLAEEFGGEDSWRELSPQISSWGKANYPAEVYRALSSSVEGVKSMHQMMTNGEPGLLDRGERTSGGVSEQSLKTLMRDPRYWRDQDPAIVAEVRNGFQKLYPDGGQDG